MARSRSGVCAPAPTSWSSRSTLRLQPHSRPADVAYGGPGTGYAFDLGVGESKSQAVPFDITHTTVNFSVSLRSGDEMGDALPGASVSLYGANSAMVGSGMTGDDGSVSIKVARAMTSGNMVNAGVSAEGYDVADGMTAVSWDPQMFATSGANSNDIVNLNVDVTVSGATVMTDYGGGDALGGWAIGVMMGDAAVAGAPTALGDDGSVAFTTTVASVPASFTFSVADDQDDDLDGGEMYEASGGGYTHTGLSLAGNMAADPIVVTYTTQTLKVYVHHEQDQVMGYTGNVLDGDQRSKDELVDIEIRQVSGNDGRLTRPISRDDWDASDNTTHDTGEYTFSHLPADMDIVVRANAKDSYKLLDLDRLDTYRNMDENGVMGGAFGDMGGWGHTVTLCPLTEVEPTGQNFGECSSFAVVSTYTVDATVSKNAVRKRGTGFSENYRNSSGSVDDKRQSGISVSLTPIEGKNLGGDGRSFTTASSDDRATTTIDERKDHNFGAMAAGSYELGLPDGWMGMAGDIRAAVALNPLADNLNLSITPSTAILYGFVRSTDGFGLEGVTVTVNDQSTTTDNLGRYIVSGINPMRPGDEQLFVNTARAGYPVTKPDSTNNPKYTRANNPAPNRPPAFAKNDVNRYDITLHGSNNTVTITGLVTESGSNAPISGVSIWVDGKAPLNATGSGAGRALKTGDEGTYTAVVEAQPFDDPLVNVSATKSDWHFLPGSFPVPAIAGSSGTANFEGRKATEITGKVTAPGGGAMSNAVVRAYGDAAKTDTLDSYRTSETGTFSLNVPTLSGTVWLDANPWSDYGLTNSEYNSLEEAERFVWFDAPESRPDGSIAVIPGQPLNFGTFTGNSVKPRITSVRRGRLTDESSGTLIRGEYTDSIVVTWAFETRNGYTSGGGAGSEYSADDADGTAVLAVTGHTTALTGTTTTPASILTPAGPGGSPAAVTGRGTTGGGITLSHTRTTSYTGTVEQSFYGEIALTIGHGVVDKDGVAHAATVGVSASATLAGVEANVRSVAAARDGNTLKATWKANGSPGLAHQFAMLVEVATGQQRWLRVPSDAATGTVTRNVTTQGSTWGQWTWTSVDITGYSTAWQIIGLPSGTTVTVTQAMLEKAVTVRVESQVDGSEWVVGMGDQATISAKP